MARSSMLVASNALGIGAASFASGNGNEFRERGRDFFWTGFGKRDGNGASKDIAESPTALPERHKKRLKSKD